MTLYKKHKAKWSNCKRCGLCRTRKRVVLARGKLPADILFIGEAPGASEDVIGKPFVGPAGKLLDKIIGLGIFGQYNYVMTNLVACIPKGDDGSKVGEPSKECIEACSFRLKEFVQLVKPKLVVLVGRLAAKHVYGQAQFDPPWLVPPDYLDFLEIIHPAAILRMDVSQKGLAIKRCVVIMENAVENLAPF